MWFQNHKLLRSSLFYKMSARHKQHEQHECDTSNKSAIRVRRRCYTNDTIATRVKNFDFDNSTSENIFSHVYISCKANERLEEEEQFHFKNYLLEIPCSHAKMHLKSGPQNLNFVMARAMWKSYTLDCSCKYPCTLPHSYV